MAQKFTTENKHFEMRLPIHGQQRATVRIERLGKAADDIVEGELIDLSLDGTTLRVSSSIDVYESVRIEIRVSDPPLKLDAKAVVRSAKRDDDDDTTYVLDCDFCPPISQDFLHELAVRQFIDRKLNPRQSVAEDASVTWPSGKRSANVQVRDISQGGFCIICEDSAQISQGMSLQLATRRRPDLPIDANVRWQLKTDWFHLVGCALNSEDDYPVLVEATSSEFQAPAARNPNKVGRMALATVGCLLVAVVAAVSPHWLKSVERLATSEIASPVISHSPVPRDQQEAPTVSAQPIATQNEPPEPSLSLNRVEPGESPDPKLSASRPTNDMQEDKEDYEAAPKPRPSDSRNRETDTVPRSRQAVEAYIQGSREYRSGRYLEAANAFAVASASDSSNPLYLYLLAIAQYQANQPERAVKTIDLAAAKERDRPIDDWGTKLMKYQGHSRLWLDGQRKEALRKEHFRSGREQGSPDSAVHETARPE